MTVTRESTPPAPEPVSLTRSSTISMGLLVAVVSIVVGFVVAVANDRSEVAVDIARLQAEQANLKADLAELKVDLTQNMDRHDQRIRELTLAIERLSSKIEALDRAREE